MAFVEKIVSALRGKNKQKNADETKKPTTPSSSPGGGRPYTSRSTTVLSSSPCNSGPLATVAPPPSPSVKSGRWSVQHTNSQNRFVIDRNNKARSLHAATTFFQAEKQEKSASNTRSTPPQQQQQVKQRAVAQRPTDISMVELQFYDDVRQSRSSVAALIQDGSEPDPSDLLDVFEAAAHGCLSGWHGIVNPLLLYRVVSSVETKKRALELLLNESMRFSWSVRVANENYTLMNARATSEEDVRAHEEQRDLVRFEFDCPWRTLEEDMRRHWASEGVSHTTLNAAATIVHSMEIFQKESDGQQMAMLSKNRWMDYHASYVRYYNLMLQHQMLFQPATEDTARVAEGTVATHSTTTTAAGHMTVAHRVMTEHDGDEDEQDELKKRICSPTSPLSGHGLFSPAMMVAAATGDEHADDEVNDEPPSSLPKSAIMNRSVHSTTEGGTTARTTAMVTIMIEEEKDPYHLGGGGGGAGGELSPADTHNDGSNSENRNSGSTVGYVSSMADEMEMVEAGDDEEIQEKGVTPSCRTSMASYHNPQAGAEETEANNNSLVAAVIGESVTEAYVQMQHCYEVAKQLPTLTHACPGSEFIPLQWAEAQRPDVRLLVFKTRRRKRVSRVREWKVQGKSPMSASSPHSGRSAPPQQRSP